MEKIEPVRDLESELAKVTKERDYAIRHLTEWAHAIDTQGSNWDEWDEWFKDVWHADSPNRQSPISYLLLAEKSKLEDEDAAPWAADCLGCKKDMVIRMDASRDSRWCQTCVDGKKAPKWMTSGADTIYRSKGIEN